MELSLTTCKICNLEHTVIAENTDNLWRKLCMLCKHEILRTNRFLAQVEKSSAFLLLNARIIASAVKIEPEEQMGGKTARLWIDSDKIILGPEPPSVSTFVEDKDSSYREDSLPMDIKIEYHDVKEEISNVDNCSDGNAYNCDEIQEEVIKLEPSNNKVFLPEYQELSYTQLENDMFECNSDAATTQNKDLKEHITTHTGEKSFQCETCQKSFLKKSHLTRHMIIHTGEKRFECPDCLKKFTYRYSLNRHMVSHTSERLYKCHDCGKDFAMKENLREHMKVHSSERPFECDICSKKFKDMRVLNSHKLLHASETPYQCNICGKGFVRRNRFRYHMDMHSLQKSCK